MHQQKQERIYIADRNRQKKLLKFLPPKLLHCQPSHYAEQVKRLWEVRSK